MSTLIRISCPMVTNLYKFIRRNVNSKLSIRFPSAAESDCSVFKVKTPFSNKKFEPVFTVNLTEIVTGKVINIIMKLCSNFARVDLTLHSFRFFFPLSFTPFSLKFSNFTHFDFKLFSSLFPSPFRFFRCNFLCLLP